MDDFDITKTLVEKGIDKVCDAISRVFGPAADELGSYFQEKVASLRNKNSGAVLEKAERNQEEIGLPKQELPLKLTTSMINEFSWEDDEYMQERWAALIANATTEGEDTTNYLSFTEILGKLSPQQVKCLDTIYKITLLKKAKKYRNLPSYLSSYFLAKELNIGFDQLRIIFDALKRFNLISSKAVVDAYINNVNKAISYQIATEHITDKQTYHLNEPILDDYSEVSLTHLGKAFVEKCQISFTDYHKEQIKQVLLIYIEQLTDEFENILQDHKTTTFESVLEKISGIYENIDKTQVQQAILRGFDSNRNIIKKAGYSASQEMSEELKGKLVGTIMDKLEIYWG